MSPDVLARDAQPPDTQPPHALSRFEALLLHGSDDARGLSAAEATDRLHRFGANELPVGATAGPLLRLGRQVHSPLIYVLLVAGAVTAALGEHVDSAVIFGVVVLNAVVGFVQEAKAEASLSALRAMVRTDARVLRDGQVGVVPSEHLVPGDVVLLDAGDKVPADLRVLRERELEADESALTGESLPVAKDDVVLDHRTVVADRRNMLWSGTLLTGGSGTAVVVATGADTELGAVHRLIGTAEHLATPLTRKLGVLSGQLTVVILGLAALTFGVGMLRGADGSDVFVAAVALAVAAIPEGLPAAMTVTLAVGVNRMARRRAVVRRMPAVETLGSTTVLCTDKTGTLTENQMTVRALWTPAGSYDVTGSGYDPDGAVLRPDTSPVDLSADRALEACLRAGLSCNDAQLVGEGGVWTVLGDPTEGALLVSAAKAGLGPDDVAPRVDTMPFSCDRQWMATLHEDADGVRTAYVKGAVERVVAMCAGARAADGRVVDLDVEAVHAAVERLAEDGLRLLALAVVTDVDAVPDGVPSGEGLLGEAPFDEGLLSGRLVLVGLQAMLDPPRADASAAVRAFRTAGIDVKMITGDHAATAVAVARRIGLVDGEATTVGVLTGEQLAQLPASERPEAVARTAVFARVSPEQKLDLVRALQDRGHVVAMTGDGVNDAPALQQADIGVAMGRGGTEVAKEAADIVLTDDDVATIEAAVEEGRGVFDNLTKFLVWTLPTNGGQALVVLVAVLAGVALPILPGQVLWINMTTAVVLGLTLAFEPKEADIMRRPPRDPAQPLVTGRLARRMLLVAVLLVGATWVLFGWERSAGASLPQARTAAVNLFVAVSILYLFSCRSLTRPARELGLLSNRWVLGGVAVQVLAQLALTYLPPMQALFHTAGLDTVSWLRVLGLAALCAGVVGVEKSITTRRVRATAGRG
ncbi:MAG: carbonate dehydratase [Frankiales bacterium]|nr:carbonate dehydratase [Frankiales bacterium]